MKQYISKAFWIFVFLLWQRQPVYGQPPPPPGDHGSEQNENPFQQAPIGNGLFVLLTLATGYVFTKSFRREAKEPNQ
jgi:hypothetical protein